MMREHLGLLILKMLFKPATSSQGFLWANVISRALGNQRWPEMVMIGMNTMQIGVFLPIFVHVKVDFNEFLV